MRIDVLYKCINVLNECNMEDIQTINVCSDYINIAYNDYLNNCFIEDIDPLERCDFINYFSTLSEFYSSLDDDNRSIRKINKKKKQFRAKRREEKERERLINQRKSKIAKTALGLGGAVLIGKKIIDSNKNKGCENK